MKKLLIAFPLFLLFLHTKAFAQVPTTAQWFCGTVQEGSTTSIGSYSVKEIALAITPTNIYLVYDFGFTPPTYSIFRGQVDLVTGGNARLRNMTRQLYTISTASYGPIQTYNEDVLQGISFPGQNISFVVGNIGNRYLMEYSPSACTVSTMKNLLD